MTFQQFLDSGLWREADVTRDVDVWRMETGRADRVTRVRHYQFWAAMEGLYDLGDALLRHLRLTGNPSALDPYVTTVGNRPKPGYDRRKDAELNGARCRCGFSGTVTAKSRLDAVCPECGSGTVRFDN